MKYIYLALLLIATPVHAWDVRTFKDRMTDRTETYATVQSGAATLYVGCTNGRVFPRLTFPRRIGYGKIAATYRFDSDPVEGRFYDLSQDGRDLWIWMGYPDPAPAAVKRMHAAKRLRVQIDRAFFDFDLSAGGHALPEMRCR